MGFHLHTIVLPSQVHPSYPYGNPTSIRHPAARPRAPHDPMSRALFDDMGYAGGGVNGALRWKDLALDLLLPVDREKEERERAAMARKMASGTNANNNPATAQRPAPEIEPAGNQGVEDDEEEEEEESEENEDDSMDEVEEDEEISDEYDMNENSENYDASYD